MQVTPSETIKHASCTPVARQVPQRLPLQRSHCDQFVAIRPRWIFVSDLIWAHPFASALQSHFRPGKRRYIVSYKGKHRRCIIGREIDQSQDHPAGAFPILTSSCSYPVCQCTLRPSRTSRRSVVEEFRSHCPLLTQISRPRTSDCLDKSTVPRSLAAVSLTTAVGPHGSPEIPRGGPVSPDPPVWDWESEMKSTPRSTSTVRACKRKVFGFRLGVRTVR